MNVGKLDNRNIETDGSKLDGIQTNAVSLTTVKEDADVADAITKKHTRSHAVTSSSDHTSAATAGKILKADANGLPVEATNTDTDVADAVTKKHTQNADTLLAISASPANLAGSGNIIALTAGENLVFGNIGYIKSDGKIWKADADLAGAYPAMVMALATINAEASGNFLILGIARNDSWTWTVGGVIYLSTTNGGMTQTKPSATDNVVQVLGVALSATKILFRPSPDYITVV